MKTWINTELTRVEKEKKAAFEKKGWKDFYTFKQGETKITINRDIEPRKTQTGKTILRGSIDGIEYDIPITINVYAGILKNLSTTNNFKVTRVGTGKQDTRYAVEAL